MTEQITTVSFFHFKGFSSKFWAFKMMQFAHEKINIVPGIQFYKLMGSGMGKGFNPFPDWSTYALLIVWENEAFAQNFIKSEIFNLYNQNTSKIIIYYLKNIKVHGLWSGMVPFDASHIEIQNNDNIAVITRATIKWKKLIRFWKQVPSASKPINKNTPGLIYTKGIGEIPVIQMATFSVWKSMDDLTNFAYNSNAHKKAIKLTRKLDWYKEELFARFIVLSVETYQ